MSKKKIYGVIPVILTPFDGNGNPDHKALSKFVNFLVDKGVHGIFACGSYGLGPLMGVEERKAVLETIVNTNNGRVAVIAHIGTTDTKSTVELAKHAQSIGADAVASVPPFYHKYSDELILRHFKDIINAVNIPVYLYNNPEKTGHLASPEFFKKLLEIGLAGMKDSSKDLGLHYKYQRLSPPEFNLLMSTEELALPSMVMGVRGFTTGMANAFPELCVKLYEACVAADWDDAQKVQKRIHQVFDIMFLGPNIPICYECVKLRGIDIGQPRTPWRPIPEELRARIKNELNALNMLSEPYL